MKENESVILLHGNEWKLKDVEDEVRYWTKENLIKEKYLARDALVDRIGGSSRPYSGKRFDEKNFRVVEKGWAHDHCEICFWTLRESEDEDEGTGYTDGNGNWICIECFEKLLNQKSEPGESGNGIRRATS
jgi:hypothetical protein